MKLISPSAEVWQQQDITAHIARCARVCYQSNIPASWHTTNTQHPTPNTQNTPDTRLVNSLLKRDHLSMLRHATHYFLIPKNPNTENKVLLKLYLSLFNYNHHYGGIQKGRYGTLFSVNGHTYHDLPVWMRNSLEEYRVTENDYFGTDDRHDFWPAKYLETYRTTVCMVTQISTSRELNRVSPNNIAEQSTRYVNFGKRGGIAICKPHWYDRSSWLKKFLARTAWRIQEAMYNIALFFGMRPEDARGFLPLDTATQVVYTYTNEQWRHIFDLRVRETTGGAHPNARHVCSLAKEAIEQRMSMFFSDYEL